MNFSPGRKFDSSCVFDATAVKFPNVWEIKVLDVFDWVNTQDSDVVRVLSFKSASCFSSSALSASSAARSSKFQKLCNWGSRNCGWKKNKKKKKKTYRQPSLLYKSCYYWPWLTWTSLGWRLGLPACTGSPCTRSGECCWTSGWCQCSWRTMCRTQWHSWACRLARSPSPLSPSISYRLCHTSESSSGWNKRVRYRPVCQ